MKELVDILFEDDCVLVLNKPSGLLTTAPPGIDNLRLRAQEYVCWRGHNKNAYLGVVHRLDRPASGAIVFGLTALGTRNLCDQFQRRVVAKTYIAAVENRVAKNEDGWLDTMRKLPEQARAEIVNADHSEAKLAELHYRVIDRSHDASLLEINLKTGRTHQIRLQASYRGHPVMGDSEYGARMRFGPHAESHRDQHIALHARSLAFQHPETSERLTFVAPFSSSWIELDLDLTF